MVDFYMHESSQNEHIKENQLFGWFEKKQECKDRLPFSETTITWELKLDWGFGDISQNNDKKKKSNINSNNRWYPTQKEKVWSLCCTDYHIGFQISAPDTHTHALDLSYKLWYALLSHFCSKTNWCEWDHLWSIFSLQTGVRDVWTQEVGLNKS